VDYPGRLESAQLHALAMFFLDLHGHGYDLGLIFFGVSNLILGYLIIKSSSFPSPFGFGLIAAALVYLLGSYTRFLFPGHMALVAPLYVIALVAELSFALWLLIKGVRV
jgi:hypothetical protein